MVRCCGHGIVVLGHADMCWISRIAEQSLAPDGAGCMH